MGTVNATQQYYVAMQIDGKEVPSSAVSGGNMTKCKAVVARLMRQPTRHKSVSWVIMPCIS